MLGSCTRVVPGSSLRGPHALVIARTRAAIRSTEAKISLGSAEMSSVQISMVRPMLATRSDVALASSWG